VESQPTEPQERRRIRVPVLLPPKMRAFRRPRLWEELLFIGLSYFLYSLIRNGVPTHERLAFHRASQLLTAEHWMHIDFELTLNKAVAGVEWIAQIANYYYATMHFAVTIGVLAWLYLRRPLQYRSVRTVLYATNIVALVGFWLFPLAPPRMLGDRGYVDTVIVFHTWGSWGSGSVDSASNQFAAMPSLHVAWALWCGIAMFTLSAKWWVKAFGVLYPCLTVLVIVVTGNHYILDAAGGVAALGIGFAIQRLLSGRPAFAPPPVPAMAPATA
jgi:hypothetical protein